MNNKSVHICLLVLFTIPLYSQNYLNIHYTDGTNQHALINTVNKITFSSNPDQINFYLSDLGLVTRDLSATQTLTFDYIGQGGILPVELVSFSARVNQNKVTLLWSTATEVDNFGFEIERMQLLSGWNKVGFVEGHGNSNSKRSYMFIDVPINGTKFQYRLKQLDKSGKFTYSNVIEVVTGTPTSYELKQNYPNPFNPITNINYSLPIEGMVTIKIFDIIGREVLVLMNQHQKAGNYTMTFEGSKFSSGVYICKMTVNNYTSSIKMLILK